MCRLRTLVALSLACSCCAGSVRLSVPELARLRTAAREIPVAFVPSPRPWVECPGDEGRQIWSIPGASRWPARPPELRGGAASFPAIALVSDVEGGDTWLAIVNGYTEHLRRSPPVDPARATAQALGARARAAAIPLPLAPVGDAVRGTDRPALTRFAAGPVLVLETTQFALVGCFYEFEPWFDVRATLLDAGSGQVLWRASCGGAYPSDPRTRPSPPQLEADGMALYRTYLLERAARCGAALLADLTRAGS